ncbi:unnamed protein product [Closterium sp. NIES-54]
MGKWVDVFTLDFAKINAGIYAMYAGAASVEGDCYSSVPCAAAVEAAALGACESVAAGTATAEALHTFTLDSSASRCFFRDCTTDTPLTTPVPVSLAEPSRGPVVARDSTGLHIPSFSKNLERYFLLVVDDYMCYTTAFPLQSKADVRGVLIPWIIAVRRQLSARFEQDLQVLRLHSDRGGELSSDLLRDFCRVEGIVQSFTLPASPQHNGIAERRIGLFMEVARTSMIHAAAPHFLWPFAVQYAVHQLNLWPRVSVPETSPTPRWTGEVGDVSAFRGPAPSGVSQVDPPPLVELLDVSSDTSGPAKRGDPTADDTAATRRSPCLETPPTFSPRPSSPPPQPVAVGSGGAGGGDTGGANSRGAESGGAGSGGAESRGAGSGGADTGGADTGGARASGAGVAGTGGSAGGAGGVGAAGAGGTGVTGATGAGGAGAAGARGAGAGGPGGAGAVGAAGAGGAGAGGTGGTGATGAGGVRAAGAGGAGAGAAGAAGARAASAGGTRATGAGGARAGGTGGARAAGAGGARAGGAGAGGTRAESDGADDSTSTVPRRPFFYPQPRSSLPPPNLALCHVLRLPSSTGLTPPLLCPQTDQSQPQLLPGSPLPAPAPHTKVTESLTERRQPETRASTPVRARRIARPRPPDVPGTHVMALRPSYVPQRVPLPSLPEFPDPESDLAHATSPTVSPLLASVVTDPDFESTAAFSLVIELVDFAARSRLDYVDYVTESESVCPPSIGDPDALNIPTPHSYGEAITGEYSSQWQTAMDAEMASSKSTGTFVDKDPPPGANIWHDTLRTTLAALGFAPSIADPSLFLRTDPTLPPFYILVYVDDLVFATADTEALTLVKAELQKRHTCTDLGELRSYLGLQITQGRARHSLLAPPLDESVEPTGPYPKLVGCLMYLMTGIRPGLAYPLSILARFVAPGRHRKEHWTAVQRVLRYLCSTSGMGLVLGGRGPVVLTGHSNASWTDEQVTQRSSQGYSFSFGSVSVLWRSTRLSSMRGSSSEAEIYVGAMAAHELCWLTYLLTDLGERPRSPLVLYVDNKAMIALCQEQRLEHRMKYIALR